MSLPPLRAFLLAAAALASPVPAQVVHLEPFAGPFDWPLAMASTRREPDRAWVAERPGTVRAVVGSSIRPTPFLDIRTEVFALGESGLLSIALHPRFPDVRRCYVHFVRLDLASVVREYVVADPPDAVVPGSGVDVLVLPSSNAGHRGGAIAFGPDGMLYVAIGNQNVPANSQSLAVPFGKLLRLDVDAPAPHVPPDNPYAAPGDGAHDLIWANGLRNPWRISFDRGTGDLWIADVGDGTFEEVDVQRPSAGPPGGPEYRGGRNYGFPCYEGSFCTDAAGCACPMTGFEPPTFEVPHSQAPAIIGGYVYRGAAIPSLRGSYVHGGLTGRVWARTWDGQSAGPAVSLTTQLDPPGAAVALSGLHSFGEDAAGEICLIGQLPYGWIWRIAPGPQPCPSVPTTLCASTHNSTGLTGRFDMYQSSPCLSMDTVSAYVSRCPPHATGRAFVGAPGPTIPFGNGTRCMSAPIARMPPVVLDQIGGVVLDLDPSSLPLVFLPGQAWAYQFLFRDASAPPAFMNTTSTAALTFGP